MSAVERLLIPWGKTRPKTRAGCASRPRPCPWVSCRHHLGLEIMLGGGLKVVGTAAKLHASHQYTQAQIDTFTDRAARAMETMDQSCALDVAEAGELKLHEIGSIMDVVRERVRQIEQRAICKVRARLGGTDLSHGEIRNQADPLATMMGVL